MFYALPFGFGRNFWQKTCYDVRHNLSEKCVLNSGTSSFKHIFTMLGYVRNITTADLVQFLPESEGILSL